MNDEYRTKQNQEFGSLLKQIMKKHGMSQKRLAFIVNCSQSEVHHWISGRREIRISNFAKAADAMGLTAQELAELLEVYWSDDE